MLVFGRTVRISSAPCEARISHSEKSTRYTGAALQVSGEAQSVTEAFAVAVVAISAWLTTKTIPVARAEAQRFIGTGTGQFTPTVLAISDGVEWNRSTSTADRELTDRLSGLGVYTLHKSSGFKFSTDDVITGFIGMFPVGGAIGIGRTGAPGACAFSAKLYRCAARLGADTERHDGTVCAAWAIIVVITESGAVSHAVFIIKTRGAQARDFRILGLTFIGDAAFLTADGLPFFLREADATKSGTAVERIGQFTSEAFRTIGVGLAVEWKARVDVNGAIRTKWVPLFETPVPVWADRILCVGIAQGNACAEHAHIIFTKNTGFFVAGFTYFSSVDCFRLADTSVDRIWCPNQAEFTGLIRILTQPITRIITALVTAGRTQAADAVGQASKLLTVGPIWYGIDTLRIIDTRSGAVAIISEH